MGEWHRGGNDTSRPESIYKMSHDGRWDDDLRMKCCSKLVDYVRVYEYDCMCVVKNRTGRTYQYIDLSVIGAAASFGVSSRIASRNLVSPTVPTTV